MTHAFQAILFDLDGTLIDSAPDLARAVNTLLTRHQLPALPVEQIKRATGDALPVFITRVFALAGASPPLPLESLGAEFRAICLATPPDPDCLYPGIRQFLDRERAAGTKLAVCTNKNTPATRRVLDALGIAGHFQSVVCGDTLPEAKPSPVPLLHALRTLDVAPAASVMIGDGLHDAVAARRAGVPIIVAAYGYAPQPWPSDIGVDAVADAALHLPRILQALGIPA